MCQRSCVLGVLRRRASGRSDRTPVRRRRCPDPTRLHSYREAAPRNRRDAAGARAVADGSSHVGRYMEGCDVGGSLLRTRRVRTGSRRRHEHVVAALLDGSGQANRRVSRTRRSTLVLPGGSRPEKRGFLPAAQKDGVGHMNAGLRKTLLVAALLSTLLACEKDVRTLASEGRYDEIQAFVEVQWRGREGPYSGPKE